MRKKSASGWWEGELQARGQKRKIGWFPANYVKLLGPGGSARSTPDASAGPRSGTPHLSASPAPGVSNRIILFPLFFHVLFYCGIAINILSNRVMFVVSNIAGEEMEMELGCMPEEH